MCLVTLDSAPAATAPAAAVAAPPAAADSAGPTGEGATSMTGAAGAVGVGATGAGGVGGSSSKGWENVHFGDRSREEKFQKLMGLKDGKQGRHGWCCLRTAHLCLPSSTPPMCLVSRGGVQGLKGAKAAPAMPAAAADCTDLSNLPYATSLPAHPLFFLPSPCIPVPWRAVQGLKGAKAAAATAAAAAADAPVGVVMSEEKQRELQEQLERQYVAGLRRKDGRTVGLGL
ncbi:unnamed protein product [Closterium sp. NIES-54]